MWALKRRELVSNLWRANKPRSVSFRFVPYRSSLSLVSGTGWRIICFCADLIIRSFWFTWFSLLTQTQTRSTAQHTLNRTHTHREKFRHCDDKWSSSSSSSLRWRRIGAGGGSDRNFLVVTGTYVVRTSIIGLLPIDMCAGTHTILFRTLFMFSFTYFLSF